MAVKKRVTVRAFHAQVRRIDCEHCGQPYSFVEGDDSSGEAQGNVLLSDSDELGRTAFRRLASGMEKRARKPQQGEGRCPHCHQYQGWMISNSRKGNMGCMGVAGLILGVALTVGASWLTEGATWAIVVGILLTLALAAGGVAGGLAMAEKPGAKPDHKDDRAKTDEQLLEWMKACLGRNQDPVLQWWTDLGHEPHAKAMTFSLGILDLAKVPSGVPDKLSTEGCLRLLNEMD
jgi:hypothetical protein